MSYQKIHFNVSCIKQICQEELSFLNIEIAYTDTKSDFNWLSKARVLINNEFVKQADYYITKQATWNNFDNNESKYVFTFYTTQANKATYRISYAKKHEYNVHLIEGLIDCNKELTTLKYVSIEVLKINN